MQRDKKTAIPESASVGKGSLAKPHRREALLRLASGAAMAVAGLPKLALGKSGSIVPDHWIPLIPEIHPVSTVAAFIGVAESGPFASPLLITSWDDYTRKFGSLIWYGFMPWAVYEFFQEGGKSCYVVRVKQSDSSQGAVATASIDNVMFSAANMGVWGNSLQVSISNSSNSSGSTGQASEFNLLVVVPDSVINSREASSDQATQLLIAYVKQNNFSITSINGRNYFVLESFSSFIPLNTAFQFQERINTQSMFIRWSTGSTFPGSTLAPVSLNNGGNPLWDFNDALDTIVAVPLLNLLAMPDTVGITSSGAADLAAQIQLASEGLKKCEKLGSVFYVIDPPYGQDIPGILSFKNEVVRTHSSQLGQLLGSSCAALYYPWVWISSPISNTSVPIPPSGPVLGRYAHTDAEVGVWNPPAGISNGVMRTVTGLFARLTDVDSGALSPNGINGIRNFIDYGNVIWGARTLSQDAQDPQERYISVRRFLIFVKQSIKNSLQWAASEPSSPFLWADVTREIGFFLDRLWHQGALLGDTASDAFSVLCDLSNNRYEVRKLGELHIDIKLVIVHPAEFITIRIIQKTVPE